MPIPTPKENENKNEFINRCMSDDVMQEYDDKKRYAICESQLEKKSIMKKTDEKRHVKEIIEDDETITIIYEKDEDFEGITIKDSDVPDEGEEETIEENDSHEEEEEVEVDVDVDEEEEDDEEEYALEDEEDLEEDIDEDEEDIDDAEEDLEDDEEDLEEEKDEEEDEDEDEEEMKLKKKKKSRKLSKSEIWGKKDKTEKRFFNVATRVSKKGNKNIIEGHAAVYGDLSEDLGGFRERIKPGAFDGVLDNDVRAFFNHDPNFLLARTSSGTLKLSTDKKGLKYSFNVPDTTAGRDLLVSMKRGDINQSSFAFTVEKDSWSESSKGTEIRTIEKVSRLFDVSPVSIPAYPSANDLAIAKRSRMIYKDKTKMNGERMYEYRRSLLELKINILKRK
tara:strand:- start:21243 stop:22421 length:1179 start_codon:yes stop_codon:yes gene_type:complete